MNELILIEDISFNIGSIRSLEDAKTFILKLETLKKLLEATDKWHENICKYCLLEAQAYCKIAELGLENIDSRQSNRYKTIVWLKNLSTKTKEEYIQECFEDGVSIESIYKKEVVIPKRKKDAISSLEAAEEEIINDFIVKGKIEINNYESIYFKKARAYLGNNIVNNQIDGIRKKIRERGGYGTGDQNGTYVNKRLANEYAREVIHTRIWSISSDLASVWNLSRELKKDGIEIEDVGLIKKDGSGKQLTQESAINVMLAILGLRKGCIEGCDSLAQLRTINLILNSLGTSINDVWELLKSSTRYAKRSFFIDEFIKDDYLIDYLIKKEVS